MLEASVLPASATTCSWEVNSSVVSETMPDSAVLQGIEFLKKWERIFPISNTWVGKEYGIPSLIVRIDGIVTAGDLHVYEIEERPCGLGFVPQMNAQFAQRFGRVRETWPEIRWVKSTYRETDDGLWLEGALTLEEALSTNSSGVRFLVRSRPEEAAYHQLEPLSISSVSREGDKSYGVTLGWWKVVAVKVDEDRELYLDLPLSDPCIVKPLQGTRARLVKAYASPAKKLELQKRGIPYGSSDFSSSRQIERMVLGEPDRKMVCQPLILPMRFTHQPGKNGIYRFYYGFDTKKRNWVPLGGVWMARRSLIVHGTPDTITGPLYCDE